MPSGVYKRTEIGRRNIGLAQKGRTAWNKGKKTGLIPKSAFKKGMIGWNKGRKYTEAQKLSMNMEGLKKGHGWNRGKKTGQLSEEHRKKIAQSNIGKPKTVGMTGKKHSQEARRKMSLNRIGIGKGKKLTEETRRKLSESHKGEKSYLWKGGITPMNKKIRQSIECKLWKKSCMERDNFTDQKTGIKGGYLVVHHINNFADFPELRFAIDNGITLSEKSHIEFHKKYGRKNNTREQLQEFLIKQ